MQARLAIGKKNFNSQNALRESICLWRLGSTTEVRFLYRLGGGICSAKTNTCEIIDQVGGTDIRVTPRPQLPAASNLSCVNYLMAASRVLPI